MKNMGNLLIRIVKLLDNKIFKGNFCKIYKRIKGRNQSFFKGKKTVVVNEPVSDLILMQYNRNEYMQYQFYDLAVRCLAIENYYGLNNFGFDLYKKMHVTGGNYGKMNLAEEYYQNSRKKNKTIKFGLVKEDHSIEQFKELIRSYDEQGYNPKSAIMCDENGLNINGSHRTALAFYREQEFINVELHHYTFQRRRFSLDWFWANGFTEKEIKQIENKENEIISTCRERTGHYYCVLYPAGEKYFDDIQKDLSNFEPNNIIVINSEDFELDLTDFVGFIKFIYKFDSILPENLERKIFYILCAAAVKKEKKINIRVITMDINSPLYRLKNDNGLPESVTIVRMKQSLRERYKVKEERFCKHYKGDYAHDVLIHSTDNYISNEAFRFWLNVNRDLTSVVELLANKEYVIVENGIEKIPENFPQSFYFNEDIDIFVSTDHLHDVSAIILDFCKTHFVHPWINIYSERTSNGERVWVKLKDSIVVMFDLMESLPELSCEFVKESLQNRIGDNYYHLPIELELTVRLAKYMTHNSKKYHADYIRSNSKFIKFNELYFTNPQMAEYTLRRLIVNQNQVNYEMGGGNNKESIVELMRVLDRNICTLFDNLMNIQYAIIQRDSYKQSIHFPTYFAIGEDIDIFINRNDLIKCARIIEKYLKNKYELNGFKVKYTIKESGISVKLIYGEWIIIEFDLIEKMNALTKDFIEKSVDNFVYDGNIKRLKLNDELNYRLAAFSNSGGKKIYHARFVLNHIGEFEFKKSYFEHPDIVFQCWNEYLLLYKISV